MKLVYRKLPRHFDIKMVMGSYLVSNKILSVNIQYKIVIITIIQNNEPFFSLEWSNLNRETCAINIFLCVTRVLFSY